MPCIIQLNVSVVNNRRESVNMTVSFVSLVGMVLYRVFDMILYMI